MTGASTGSARAGFEGYDEVRRAAAVEIQPPGGLIALTGRDAGSFLQGVLTNDVAALGPGHACYAAYLTAQGRMVSDMQVLRRDRDFLLVVEPHAAAGLAARFDQSIFTEDVRVEDRSAEVSSIALHGPDAWPAAIAAIPHVTPGLDAGGAGEGRHATLQGDHGEIVVLGASTLGASGVRVVGAGPDIAAIRRRLSDAGVPLLGDGALEARRIEAGTPVFGTDMTTDTIPLEAGIDARAISTTKGCYVGQEIIVRILHRAHGRVARRLVGLVAAPDVDISPGSRVYAGGREVGLVTSAGWSPALDAAIALAIVHRDAFEPGTVVSLGDAEGPSATVRDLPLVPPAPSARQPLSP